jgi:hypothetical protein
VPPGAPVAAPPPRKPPPPPRLAVPPRGAPGPVGPPRPPSPAPGRPGRLGALPGLGGRGGIMPGFGRAPPLPDGPVRPELGRLPPLGRGGMLLGPDGLAAEPDRCPDERGGAELPTPKGLLPTRAERGPGFGDRGVGCPGAPPSTSGGAGATPPPSGRRPVPRSAGRRSAGGGWGVARRSTAGGWDSAGLALAAGRSPAEGGSPTGGRAATIGSWASAGRRGDVAGGTPGVAGGTPGEGPPGADSARAGREGAGLGVAMASPAAGWIPLEPAPFTRPLADAPLAGDGMPASEGLPASAGKESRSLRATGASTVEEADFTYSPRSASFLSTSLLVTPSSFASSCTRALPATALLTGGAGGNPARPRY